MEPRPHDLHEKSFLDFPGGLVVQNPPANAGDIGSIPRSGKIPHASRQLSLCATATEPTRSTALVPQLLNLRATANEAP